MRAALGIGFILLTVMLGVAMSRAPTSKIEAPAEEVRTVSKPLFDVKPVPEKTIETKPPVPAETKEEIVPNAPIVLNDEVATVHRQNIDFLNKLSYQPFSPWDEVVEIGVNEQGLSEYDFDTANGDRVHQWYTPEGYPSVEQITRADGSMITRRYFNNTNQVQEISYIGVEGYRRMWFTEENGIEALETGSTVDRTDLYRYNPDGAVREIWQQGGDEWTRTH